MISTVKDKILKHKTYINHIPARRHHQRSDVTMPIIILKCRGHNALPSYHL